MTRATQDKCLIIIPQDWAKHKGEPDWSKVLKTIRGHKPLNVTFEGQPKLDDMGLFYKDNNMATYVIYLLAKVIIDNERKLIDLIMRLHDCLEEINIFNKRTVLVGHFQASITQVRIFFEKARKTATKDEKKKLQKFEDPIMGRGNFIIDSYTLGATVPWNVGATDLINQLKETEKEEEVKSLFRGIFDFFWYQHNLLELITNIQGQLFMYGQSGGICGLNELQDSIANLKEYEKILRDENEVNEDLSLIYKVGEPYNQELNHEEIKEVNTQLDRILLAILKKRDGEKSATKTKG